MNHSRHLHVALLLAVGALSGCATGSKLLENRVACTADKSEAHVVSKWGGFSIGAQVADADAKVICNK